MADLPENKWTEVITRKKPNNKGKIAKTANPVVTQPVNVSKNLPKANTTTVVKKNYGNKPSHTSLVAFRKLDGNEEVSEMKKILTTVSKTLGQKISQARVGKGMNRVQLATSINERENVLGSWENGTAVFSQHILTKINRSLSTSFKRGD